MRTIAILSAAISLVGCGGSLECGAGTTEVDGACTAELEGDTGTPTTEPTDPEPSVDDILAALPDCTPAKATGGLDFALGCVDGGCVGDSLAALEAAWGTGSCVANPYSSDLSCSWSRGVSTSMDDEDGDGLVDPGSTANFLSVRAPYDGTDNSGLGLDVGMKCFLDRLGPPDGADFTLLDNGDWGLQGLDFTADGVWVSDYFGEGYAFEPDGLVDSLFLLGP